MDQKKVVDRHLEQYIFDTIRYFDIFEMPVTATQIWRSLVVTRSGTGVRWQGQRVVSLRQLREALQRSRWLKERMENCWGYYCLRGAGSGSSGGVRGYVRRRLVRHILAQYKWKIARRVVRLLAPLPFVRMIGVTGSLALGHTRPASDLDLFIIVRRGRIWTARLWLLLVTQLMGRRRKHWNEEAPDKICLNHYIVDSSLTMAAEIRNLYTAVLYTQAIPLTGLSMYRRWIAANGQWMRRWLMYPAAPILAWRQAVKTPRLAWLMQRWAESLLLEPIGGGLEWVAEKVQRRTMLLHADPGRAGRVVVSDTELAFHPDSKESHVLRRFAEEYGQGRLL